MNAPRLPVWVASFCCVTPFVALIAFAATASSGATVGTPALICLVILCGKIVGKLLNDPHIEPDFRKIGDRRK
jgi:hypothetical protein